MDEIKLGHKKTEVGVIPEDWKVAKLGEIGSVIRGASPRPKGDKRYYGGNIPRLMVEDVTRDGKYVTPKVDFLTEEGAKRSRPCKKGTLTIVCSGTVGIPSILAVDACIHDGFLALIDINNDVSDDYLYHQLSMLQSIFDASATHGGVFTNLTTSILHNFGIALPPTLTEQQAIANALNEVDDQITTLDDLITKKRNLKQGAMQRLLTGEERLPGFNRKWITVDLAESSKLKARIGWQGLTTAEYLESGEFYLVTGTDFVAGRIDWEYCFFVDRYRYEQDRNIQLQVGDVLVTKDGTIGKVAFVDHLPKRATLNSGIFVIRPSNQSYAPLFLYYILHSSIFGKFLAKLQAGSTINHLYQKDFVGFKFSAPQAIEEQEAIAQILFDIDAEISALEKKREKTVAVKQGMMQELLTGKTRLV